MNCNHEKKELRYKPYKTADGTERKHYCYQCTICGKSLSKVWEKSPTNESGYKEFDFKLNEYFLEKESKERTAKWEAERQEKIRELRRKHREYDIYINNSPLWQEKRQLVMERTNSICEACLIATATQVHHLNYDSLYNEICYDLKAVCASCHKKIHNKEFAGTVNV